MSVAAGLTFMVALFGLVLVPRQASRVAQQMTISLPDRPDTMAMVRMGQSALANLIGTDSLLADARRRLALPPVPAPLIDTFPPVLRAERDSLRSLLAGLDSAMGRAEESPLPPSFRALAESRAFAGSQQIRVKLDSLNTIDAMRVPFGALGAGDPTYIALTARLNELGRSIRDAATLKRSELRARIAPLLPVRPPPVARYHIDTMPLIGDRTQAQRLHGVAIDSLVKLRVVNRGIDSTLTIARQLGNLGAPPIAMLSAALVIALAAGFGVAIVGELKQPRIAHVREAESIAGERVLTVIRPSPPSDESLQYTSFDAPPPIDPASESYHTLYLHLAATGAAVPVVTVTGDNATVVSTIAANLAAVAERESRATLLIDEITKPGLAPEYDFVRLKRQYDFIVVATAIPAPTRANTANPTAADAIPRDAVILCARVGSTRLAAYQSAIRILRATGHGLRGVVLWEDQSPNYG